MIYVSPVNNHAMVITLALTSTGVAGKVYQLFTTEGVGNKLYSMVKETYEFTEAMEWLGVVAYDYRAAVMIEEEKNV